MKLKLSTIVFDFDGVIVDSGADIAGAINYTLKYFGKPVLPKDEIISYVGHGAENLVRRCFKGSDEEFIKKALPFYTEYYLDNCVVETRLYNNLKETLEFFKNKKMAVVTNKPEKLTKKILTDLKVFAYFDLVIGPESVRELKPNPEGLLKVLETFNETPENAIMIGDSYTDVEVGRNAGMHTCGVTYGLGDKNKLIGTSPDFLIDDIGKLKDMIE
jgi:phosphoglycolate phosphatase